MKRVYDLVPYRQPRTAIMRPSTAEMVIVIVEQGKHWVESWHRIARPKLRNRFLRTTGSGREGLGLAAQCVRLGVGKWAYAGLMRLCLIPAGAQARALLALPNRPRRFAPTVCNTHLSRHGPNSIRFDPTC
jgi:hypothetical protein